MKLRKLFLVAVLGLVGNSVLASPCTSNEQCQGWLQDPGACCTGVVCAGSEGCEAGHPDS